MSSSFLQRIAQLLLSRTLWLTLGLLLIVLLIWLAGPLLAIGEYQPLLSEAARLWTIAALLAFLLLRALWRRWRRSSANNSVAERLREFLQAGAQGETEEVKLLRSRFNEALEILRRARFGSGARGLLGRFAKARYLYELPWYIIIGAPGVGKTTALQNCGLDFPLAKSLGKGAVKGIGGTRNCDWWFTNQAVLIDTAGRYTTHDSDAESDRAEWRGFMGLLRKSRRLQPINGVLLTISVVELLDATPEERKHHIETLRLRLDELREDLGIRYPVYLLINKCDLLCGFDEYFASLDRAGREQVWGFTLPFTEGGASGYSDEVTAHELALLRQRIHAGLAATLLAEPELSRRARIHSFTQQFALLCEVLQEVSAQLFIDSRFSAAPLLRGMYFTSATQEGTPLDRVIRAMNAPTHAHAQATQRGTAKSYFLNELLTQVVFSEAHLVGRNRRADRRARLLHLGAYAASVLLLTGGVAAWLTSYHNNLAYLAEVDSKTDRLQDKLKTLPQRIDASGNLRLLLTVLSEAESLSDSAHFRVSAPLRGWTFGLYQGKKLKIGAAPIYEKLLRMQLAPTIEARVERLLRTDDANDLEFSYEALKAYLMLHERARFDDKVFKTFVLTHWNRNSASEVSQQELQVLGHHLDALMDLGAMQASRRPDTDLLESARARLAKFSFVQRSYRYLVQQLQNNHLPDFSIAKAVGYRAHDVFKRASGKALTDGIDSLYTARGYHQLFVPRVEQAVLYVGRNDAWVLERGGISEAELAKGLASGELVLKVKRLYLSDYIRVWDSLISDIDLISPSSLDKAAALTRELVEVNSPLVQLMQALAEQTSLLKFVPDNVNATSVLGQAKEKARAVQNDVAHLLGADTSLQEKPERMVDEYFAALHRMAGTDGTPSSLKGVLETLEMFYELLEGAQAASLNGGRPPENKLSVRLKSQGERLPFPAKRLLDTLASSGATLLARQTRSAQSAKIQGTVTRECRNTIAGRYPFKSNAKDEVQSKDFARMFAAGGIMENHFNSELSDWVDTSKSPWRLISGAQGGLGNSRALVEFERAAVIKNVFFAGGDEALLRIQIKPSAMDQTIERMRLDVNGQLISLYHSPPVAKEVQWSITRGGRVHLSLEPKLEGGINDLILEGSWALHRLFDSARIEHRGSGRFHATVNLSGRKVTFEVATNSVKNPFALRELKDFSCPSGL